jgi:methylenetetrahydrofolate dehydrogenase (NADP+) / methenyltetrahydrofolate cyclohydrolase
MPQILDGNRVRDDIKSELKPRVEAVAAHGAPPGLAVVLVGNNPASEIYVRNKIKACHDLGIYSESITPPGTISTEELLSHGAGSERAAGYRRHSGAASFAAAGGYQAHSAGGRAGQRCRRLPSLQCGQPGGSLTRTARLHARRHSGIAEALPHSGGRQRAVVVGRSDIVGKPVAMLLLHEHATVTICHSKTADLPAVCREADILVAAMGRPAMITGDYMKQGVTVIDVGTNRLDSREEVARIFRNSPEKLAAYDKKGSVLVGDVHPLDVVEKSSAYTPVPGGVGPLTIAMLMVNTVASAERRAGIC